MKLGTKSNRKKLIQKLDTVVSLIGEHWKPIVGYKDLYEVSNFGRVKSLTRYYTDNIGRERIYYGKLLILTPDRNGYAAVFLYRDAKVRRFNVHRLVATAFIENPENKKCVNHIDYNRLNNVATNLEWATYSENNQYSHSGGRYKNLRADKAPNAKLTRQQVLDIRNRLNEGIPPKILTKEYNVTKGCISGIKTGRVWGWLN